MQLSLFLETVPVVLEIFASVSNHGHIYDYKFGTARNYYIWQCIFVYKTLSIFAWNNAKNMQYITIVPIYTMHLRSKNDLLSYKLKYDTENKHKTLFSRKSISLNLKIACLRYILIKSKWFAQCYIFVLYRFDNKSSLILMGI